MNITNENGAGIVFRKSLGHYTVHTNGQEIRLRTLVPVT
jgi:hypothetical protein